MSVTGFLVNGKVQKYDYESLDNLPDDTGAGSFPVIYNVTTASEITQALNKNQIPILKDPTTGSLYYLNSSAELNGDRMYIFVSNQGNKMRQVEVLGNTWGNFSDTILALNTSPTFQGIPKAPTAPIGTNNTQLATTAFVHREIMYGALSEDLKQALLQIASKVVYIDDDGQTYYNDLENALYPHDLLGIEATFTQGSAIIYDIDSLNDLKQYLTVVAIYSDGDTETLSDSDYTLSGNLLSGVSEITVAYEGFTDTFNVVVTHMDGYYTIVNNLTECTTNNSATSIQENTAYTATITASDGYTLSGATATITMGGNILTGVFSNGTISIPSVTGDLVITVVASATTVSSISAVYTQSGTVYNIDTLDSLKADLVVTAHYSDSSTQTVPAAYYTLSGTLTVGTSTITVSYGGRSTTFSVEVTDVVPAGYESVDYIFSPNSSSAGPIVDTGVRFSGVGDATIEISFMDYSTANSYPIGCLDSTTTNEIGFGVSIRNDSNKDVIAFTGGTPASVSPSPLNNVRIDAVATVNSSGISITDGTLSNTQTLTPRAYNVSNIYIFGIKNAASTGVYLPFTGRIYYVKITENNVVLAELLPCVRLSDGMAGFWDLVNETFIYASELVAAPSEHNTTANIEQGGKILVHDSSVPTSSLVLTTLNKANCGITKMYNLNSGPSSVLYPSGIIPTYSISSMSGGSGKNAVLAIYDDSDTIVTYADEISTSSFNRWAQNANGTMTEYSQSWTLQDTYSKIVFSVDMRYLHDAYMCDKTTGQVFFAGRNTPYYGMSNISEAQ